MTTAAAAAVPVRQFAFVSTRERRRRRRCAMLGMRSCFMVLWLLLLLTLTTTSTIVRSPASAASAFALFSSSSTKSRSKWQASFPAALPLPPPFQRYYYYFAYGSNVLPDTMKNLRRIRAANATAAVLPDYELAFNVPGSPLFEPSAASVRPNEAAGAAVHGVLYRLGTLDFAKVSATEGVPFAYRWEPVIVYPYVGSANQNEGRRQLELLAKPRRGEGQQQEERNVDDDDDFEPPPTGIEAYTLVRTDRAANSDRNANDYSDSNSVFIPPSASYLKIIRDGAEHWNLDESYQIQLQQVPTARNLAFPFRDGVSGRLLDAANTAEEARNRFPLPVLPFFPPPF